MSLLDGKVALKDLAITKQLTKDPSDYADRKSLPHVQVNKFVQIASTHLLVGGGYIGTVLFSASPQNQSDGSCLSNIG